MTEDERDKLRALCESVFRHRRQLGEGEIRRQQYDSALADYVAYATASRVYSLLRPWAWAKRARDVVRTLRGERGLHERIEIQRQELKAAHLALVARAGFAYLEAGSIADAIHRLADERDTLRDRLAPKPEDGPVQLCGECGHKWSDHMRVEASGRYRHCLACDCFVAGEADA